MADPPPGCCAASVLLCHLIKIYEWQMNNGQQRIQICTELEFGQNLNSSSAVFIYQIAIFDDVSCPEKMWDIHKYKLEHKGISSGSESLQTSKEQQNEPTAILPGKNNSGIIQKT